MAVHCTLAPSAYSQTMESRMPVDELARKALDEAEVQELVLPPAAAPGECVPGEGAAGDPANPPEKLATR